MEVLINVMIVIKISKEMRIMVANCFDIMKLVTTWNDMDVPPLSPLPLKEFKPSYIVFHKKLE